jgi:dihydrolipoamide dehydrogenase
MNAIEVRVPDIGDFKSVDVIEVLVKPGDRIEKEASLITVESDKATMEIPSPAAGVVKQLTVKIGDKVSEGSPILMLESAGEAQAKAPAAPAPSPKNLDVVPKGTAVKSGAADVSCEVLVLGSGPGGYTAAFRAADLGKNTVLVERYSSLGGVCLNVGCIPSKALLHAAKVVTEVEEMSHFGVAFGKPKFDVDKLREWKEAVVGRLTKGLVGLAKQRKVTVVQGVGKFESSHTLTVETAEGAKRIAFDACIVATGSSIARLPGFPYDDPRLVDSTGALAMPDIPKRMLVIGGGIIGLEMACVYDALDTKVTVVELDQKALRSDSLKDESGQAGSEAGWARGDFRRTQRAVAANIRSRIARGGTASERSRHRRRQGGRAGERARLHSGGQAAAHQRAAHLRHR